MKIYQVYENKLKINNEHMLKIYEKNNNNENIL